MFHVWSMQTGHKEMAVKMIELTKTHGSIQTMAFSHKYRVGLASDFYSFSFT